MALAPVRESVGFYRGDGKTLIEGYLAILM
jgi:hypothetical protein